MIKKKQNIFGSYNHEDLLFHLKRAREKKRFERYFREGVEFYNTRALSDNKREQLLFIGNHVSHFDYLLASTAFLDNLPDGRFPHIIAGNSLDVPFLPLILGFNYRQANVCWLDRERTIKDKDYLERWAGAVRRRLSNGESFMYYPEGTRVFNKNCGIENVKGGLFINQILDARVDPLVCTVTTDYDFSIEEPYSDLILWSRKKQRGMGGLLKKFIYYGTDVFAFLKRPLLKESGKAYFRVGEPKRLSEIIDESDRKKEFLAVRDFVVESINHDYELIQREKS
jgi:1-acyl-sn-glycerol-3-phosphate acyltransferase